MSVKNADNSLSKKDNKPQTDSEKKIDIENISTDEHKFRRLRRRRGKKSND